MREPVHMVWVCSAARSGECPEHCGANLCDRNRVGAASTERSDVTCPRCLKMIEEGAA